MKTAKRLARVCANAHRHDICAVPWCECRCHKRGRYVIVKGEWVYRRTKRAKA